MWTDDQLKAIESPVSDILVTAAAGSGKTAVMVERLIQRIISPDGTDIDKILVVTFTKAAAAEIKERIASKIAEKLEEGDNPRLKNQLVLINRASICTIHSFCLDILKNNFHLLNLSPDFKVGDTTDIALLRAKALGDVLDAHYDSDDADFLRIINSFTKKRDDVIEDIILSIYNFSQSAPDPDGFLDFCCDVYSGNCDIQMKYILNTVSGDASYAVHCYKRAMRLCLLDSSFEKAMNIIGEEMDFAKNFINSMIRDMGLSAIAVEVEPAGDVDFIRTEGVDVYPAINIEGDDTGILIGHHGETLDAVQYLVNLALFRRANSSKSGRENIKITVDIENYRAKREETLRALARRMAARAVKYKKNVFLEPMNPYERRIIHSELQEYPDVDTHSVGSDTNRKIIITYEGTDKPAQKSRRRNGRRPARNNTPAVEETVTPVGIPLPTLDDINE